MGVRIQRRTSFRVQVTHEDNQDGQTWAHAIFAYNQRKDVQHALKGRQQADEQDWVWLRRRNERGTRRRFEGLDVSKAVKRLDAEDAERYVSQGCAQAYRHNGVWIPINSEPRQDCEDSWRG